MKVRSLVNIERDVQVLLKGVCCCFSVTVARVNPYPAGAQVLHLASGSNSPLQPFGLSMRV